MFVLKRKSLVITAVFVVIVITFCVCFHALKSKPSGTLDRDKITIVLDAGHGGIDGGVSGVTTGVKESDLNLLVVNKIKNYLVSAGLNVVLTRNSDAGLYGVATKNRKKKDMQKRREIILKANPTLVVSIHMNNYSMQSRRGAQVFYKTGDENGKVLASKIQESLNQMPTASRSCDVLKGDYYLLNCSDYPSALVECGFLSNPEDEKQLISNDYQEELAYTIFKGIIEYLSFASFKFCD